MNVWSALAEVLYRSRSTYAIPTNLGVCMTPHCNINCVYCMRQKFTPPGPRMTLGKLKDILFRMPYISGVCIMGLCEPFLNPELPTMIRWMHDNGYSMSCTTNGTVPINDLECLTYIGDFVVSIDTADPETFTYLRGGANLDTVMGTLESIIQYKRDHGLTRCDNPPIHINSVITQQNIDQMEGLFDMLLPYANDLTYVMVDPVSRPDYQEWERPLALTGDEFKAKLDAVHEIAKRSPLNILGFDYMLKPSTRWDRCPLSWTGPFIEPNGDMYFCYDYELVLGNVLTQNPLAVWNSPMARSFRRQLMTRDPPLQQCRTCNFARSGWQPSGDYNTQGQVKQDVG